MVLLPESFRGGCSVGVVNYDLFHVAYSDDVKICEAKGFCKRLFSFSRQARKPTPRQYVNLIEFFWKGANTAAKATITLSVEVIADVASKGGREGRGEVHTKSYRPKKI